MRHITFSTRDFPSPVSIELFWPHMESLEILGTFWGNQRDTTWEGILESLPKLPNLKYLKLNGRLPLKERVL